MLFSATPTAFAHACPLRLPANPQISHSTPHLPLCCLATNSTPAAPTRRSRVMADVLQYLHDTTPNTFAKGVEKDYSKYSKDVQFTDPLNNFSGIGRHAANIEFLGDSPLFSDATLDYHDIRLLDPSASPYPDVIRARWTLCMVFKALPWKPRVLFTGLTDYVVDIDSEQIVRHIDYWDSLADSSYFSFSGLKDFVSMCLPSYPIPFDVIPNFKLLLRNSSFQIWRFENDVSLSKRSDSSSMYTVSSLPNPKSADEISTESDIVRLIAVITLSSEQPSNQLISEKTDLLKAGVDQSSFATAGTRSFCVRLDSRPSPTYHIWLELTDVRLTAE